MRKFAFIAHPITARHLSVVFNGILSKAFNMMDTPIIKSIFSRSPSFEFASCKNIKSPSGQDVEGTGIMCPLLPEQFIMMDKGVVLDKISHAIDKAKKKGAEIVTLGGFTSIVGDQGAELAKRHTDIALTSGNTCTATLTIQSLTKAAKLLDMNLRDASMCIVGATGDIGSICSKIFAKRVKTIKIVARNMDNLEEFKRDLQKDSIADIRIFKYTKDAVKNSDIVLTTTSSVTTLIDPMSIKAGSVLCDISIPPNIPKEIRRVRDDILVFEGGTAELPFYEHITGEKWKELMPGNRIYGCLTESIVLSFEERFENLSVGRGHITEQKVENMSDIMKKHAILPAEFYCEDYFYSDEDIKRIKNARSKGNLYV